MAGLRAPGSVGSAALLAQRVGILSDGCCTGGSVSKIVSVVFCLHTLHSVRVHVPSGVAGVGLLPLLFI